MLLSRRDRPVPDTAAHRLRQLLPAPGGAARTETVVDDRRRDTPDTGRRGDRDTVPGDPDQPGPEWPDPGWSGDSGTARSGDPSAGPDIRRAGPDTRRAGPDDPGSRPPSHAVRRKLGGLLGLPGALLDPGRRGIRALVVIALITVVVAGMAAWRLRPVTETVAPPDAPAAPRTSRPGATASSPAGHRIVVAVAGKVRRPGLVRLRPGARVADAISAAGGTLPGADVGLLNLARKVVDGEQILVGVTPPPAAAAGASPGPAARINLNTATAADLDRLPGIGPALAQRILSFRTEHGVFRSVDELKQVSGIGAARYADLKDLVTV